MSSDPAWDREDVAQQAAEIELRRGGRGRSSRARLRVDALRELGGATSRLVHTDPVTRAGRYLPDVAASPREKSEKLHPATLVEEIRDRYEAEGCLWSRAFEAWLGVRLAPLAADGTEERVLAWIDAHAGEETTQGRIAREIGLRRETTCRVLGALRLAGRVRSEPLDPVRSRSTRYWRTTCED